MTQFELPGFEYYARFPELYHSSLKHVSVATAAEYIPLLMPLLKEQLAEQGPLQAEALRYHVNRANHLQLELDDINHMLWKGGDQFERFFLAWQGPKTLCWRLAQSESENAVNSSSRYAMVKDFETGYYELLNLLKLIREDPAHANSPIEYLRKLGVV